MSCGMPLLFIKEADDDAGVALKTYFLGGAYSDAADVQRRLQHTRALSGLRHVERIPEGLDPWV